VFIIFGNSCEFYQDAKCLKKNAFCDLKCDDMDGFEGRFEPLRESLDTEGKSEENSDLKNLLSFRVPGATIKK
jgi:hypothetical protein